MNKNRTKVKRRQKERRLMKKDELAKLTDSQPGGEMNQPGAGARPGGSVMDPGDSA